MVGGGRAWGGAGVDEEVSCHHSALVRHREDRSMIVHSFVLPAIVDHFAKGDARDRVTVKARAKAALLPALPGSHV